MRQWRHHRSRNCARFVKGDFDITTLTILRNRNREGCTE